MAEPAVPATPAAPSPMRLRAVRDGDRVVVKVLMAHPMETGLARDAEGQLIPAWFIQQVDVRLDGEVLLQADWGPAISRNPFLEFELQGVAAGALLQVRWLDNRGAQREDGLPVP